jgi:hypothetical protein
MAEDFQENAPAPFSEAPPGHVHGPTAMRGTVAWLTGQYPDLRMEVEALIAEDGLVAMLQTGIIAVPGPPS